MNPILVIMVFAAGGLLWLLCSFLYKPIGRFLNRLFSDAKHEMLDETKEKDK